MMTSIEERGLKGLSAYSKHANALMQDDEDVDIDLLKQKMVCFGICCGTWLYCWVRAKPEIP